MIDRFIVISLPRRTDRREAFESGWPLDVPFEYFDAIEATPSRGWRDTAGMYGCWLSHRAVWDQCQGQTVAIFEDDAVFAPDFRERFEHLTGQLQWDALMLGGEHSVPPRDWLPGIVRCYHAIRTHAYVVGPHALQALATRLPYCTGGFDGLVGLVLGHMNTLAPDPFIVGQTAGYSDISYHDEPERWWSVTSERTLREHRNRSFPSPGGTIPNRGGLG